MPYLSRIRLTSLRPLLLASAAALLAACATQVRLAPAIYAPPVAVVQVRIAPPPLPASPTRLRATALPGRGVALDAGILAMGSCRILLGPWNLGGSPTSGIPMDTGLLGLRWRSLPVACRILGPTRGILWGRALRVRIRRRRLPRRTLGRPRIRLQPSSHPCQRHDHS